MGRDLPRKGSAIMTIGELKAKLANLSETYGFKDDTEIEFISYGHGEDGEHQYNLNFEITNTIAKDLVWGYEQERKTPEFDRMVIGVEFENLKSFLEDVGFSKKNVIPYLEKVLDDFRGRE